MARMRNHLKRGKVQAALAALVVQFGLAAMIIWGLTVHFEPQEEDNGSLAALVPLPPRPEPEPEPEPKPEPQGEAAPEGEKGEAVPREAPSPRAVISPSPAAPTPEEGRDASAGAGTEGAGAGAGGMGTGTGAGGSGDGSGAIATPAQRIAGELRDSDYPRSARKQRAEGNVAISFRVRTDGRVDRCTVTRSSGHAILDDLTCRLFTERFRFRPAMTASGQPVATTLSTNFTWGTRRR